MGYEVKDLTDFKKRGEFQGTKNKRAANKDQFISVLNNSPDIIYRFNLQTGQYEFISPAIRTLGYKPEEVMAMSKEEVISRFHPDDRSSMVSFLSNINDVGEGLRKYRFQKNNGQYRWLSHKIVIIKDDQGKPLYHDGFVRDITQDKLSQKKLKESEVRFRSLYESNFDATLITLPDGSILSTNPAAQKMFGMTREEIIKAGREGLVVKDENLKQAIKEREKKGYIKAELTLKRKNGSIFTGEMTSSYFKDADGTIKTSMIIRDLTEQIKAEKNKQELLEKEKQLREDLEISNHELQNTSEELYTSNKELRQIQRELKETIKKLEISNTELEQFAYVASHDLQEPLRMVASFTQLLERKYKGHIDGDADDYIGFIVEGSNRMKDLIDDLLAFSRLNIETKEFKQTDLSNILDDVLLSMHTSIEENNAKITHDTLPTVKCDHSQIRQLFQNLITNAIKFHDKKPPKIHISSEKIGNKWKFSVQDNGIGINPQHQKKIFNVFNRLHSREEYEGTGIGLSIAKRIINHHKGRIWVESELGEGSTFYFTIPKDL